MLTMALCGAILFTQHWSAMQCTAMQNSSRSRVAAGAGNPLRQSTQAGSGLSQPRQVLAAAQPSQSEFAAQESQAFSVPTAPPLATLTATSNQDATNTNNVKQLSTRADKIPPDVMTAIFPNRNLENVAQKDASNADQPAEAAVQGEFVDQGQATTVQPVSHAEPVRTEMKGDFSRLPSQPISGETDAFESKVPTTRKTLGTLLSERAEESAYLDPPANTGSKSTDHQSALGTQSSPGLQALLQKIAVSTCIVMVLGVAFILVAKRWVSTNTAKPAAKQPAQTITITSTLRLTPKSNLHLVEVGSQRVLVACDLTGIKSVVSLNHTFSETLDAFEGSAGAMKEPLAAQSSPSKSAEEIEAEMQQKLSQILGGEAFKDVFYKTRAVA